jgi:hypothetical protein
MEKNEISTIETLSDAELDVVGAGSVVSLSNFGNLNLNVGVVVPIANNIAVLSIAKQISINLTNLTQTAG